MTMTSLCRYLLDTTVVNDWWRGHPAVVDWLDIQTEQHTFLSVSGLTVAEAFAGCHPDKLEERTRAVHTFHFLPLGVDASLRAGAMRSRHAREGKALHSPDLLQAALALEAHCVVATSNARNFPDVATFDPRTWTGGTLPPGV